MRFTRDPEAEASAAALGSQGFSAPAAYRDRLGDLEVPVKFVTDDGVKLGLWLHNLRRRYRSGGLEAVRIAALEDLGVVWHPPRGPRRRRAGERAGGHETAGTASGEALRSA